MTVTELQLPIPLDELQKLLRKYGVTGAYIFGSYARGEATADSDLDLLVELGPNRSYLDLGGLQYELSQRLPGKKADIVLEGTLRKRIKPYVDREKVPISI
jgi:predicted nucleotidyltransferase